MLKFFLLKTVYILNTHKILLLSFPVFYFLPYNFLKIIEKPDTLNIILFCVWILNSALWIILIRKFCKSENLIDLYFKDKNKFLRNFFKLDFSKIIEITEAKHRTFYKLSRPLKILRSRKKVRKVEGNSW